MPTSHPRVFFKLTLEIHKSDVDIKIYKIKGYQVFVNLKKTFLSLTLDENWDPF